MCDVNYEYIKSIIMKKVYNNKFLFYLFRFDNCIDWIKY